jgi:hypothetical protein
LIEAAISLERRHTVDDADVRGRLIDRCGFGLG